MGREHKPINHNTNASMPLIEDLLRSIYFDVTPSTSTAFNAQISSCLSSLDQLPEALIQSSKHTFNTLSFGVPRMKITFTENNLLPHVEGEILFLPKGEKHYRWGYL